MVCDLEFTFNTVQKRIIPESRPMVKQLKASYSVAWIKDIAEVDKIAWNSLAAAMPSPFFEWEWLHQIEASGSTGAQTGWLPFHLTIWTDTRLVAAAPLYIKGHSAGEFVFDHIWADVAGQMGIEYYPKLHEYIQ